MFARLDPEQFQKGFLSWVQAISRVTAGQVVALAGKKLRRKYTAFREPGDVHCHFFGTATLSSAAGVVPHPGDLFEISAPEFGRALRNPLVRVEEPEGLIAVQVL